MKKVIEKPVTKTMTFAAVHFSVAFAVGYLMTGSIVVGGAIALVEPMVNTVAYHFHEMFWKKIEQGKQPEKGAAIQTPMQAYVSHF